MNPVLKTTLLVVQNSQKVKINRERIKKFAEEFARKIKIPRWPKNLHLESKNPRELLTYLIILDSLNFCFWPKEWRIKYKNKIYSGYYALSLTLKKFFEKNKGRINFDFLNQLSFNDFYQIFKKAPLIEERFKILKRVSEFMAQKYPDPLKFILSANKSAKILLTKIYKNIPYFNDFNFYCNKKIYFLKRAQILIADIYWTFDGKGLGYFKDIGYLTCFADYKLPQILNYYGILEYSKDLENKIKRRRLIKKGSVEEMEIRANTIWAVEFLKKELRNYDINLKSFEIDWFLWNRAQKLKFKLPHHLTKTINY